MIQENFRILNRITVEFFLTFSVSRQWFQVHDLCEAATEVCHLIHGICLNHRETFLAIHVLCSMHHRHLIKEFFTPTTPSATGSIPVQVSTGRPVARGDKRIGSTTPMPMSARRPSTMISFLPAKVPQNSLAVQQRLQISELQFDKFPTPSTFSCWKISPSQCLFRFFLGGNVMDQRSGDGRFSG